MYGIIKKEDDFSAPIGVNISAQKMLTHGDGKTEDPSIGFNSDPTTGWYINAEGEVVFTTYGRDNIIQGYYHTEFKKPIVLASVNNIDDDDILSEGNGYLYKKYNNDGLFWKTKNKEIDLSKIADVVDYKVQSNEIINNEIKKLTNKVNAAESDIINKILDKIPNKIADTVKNIVTHELQSVINQEVYKNALSESSDRVLDELSNQLPVILTGILPNTLPDILPQMISDILPQMISSYRAADLDVINTIKLQVNNNSADITNNTNNIKDHTTSITNNTNSIKDHTTSITKLDHLTNSYNTKLTDIYGKLVIDDTRLLNLTNDITNFKNELVGIHEKIDNKITRLSGGIGTKFNELLNKTNELGQNTDIKITNLLNKTNELERNIDDKLNNMHALISVNKTSYDDKLLDLSENIKCVKSDVEHKTKSCTDLINNIIDTYTNTNSKTSRSILEVNDKHDSLYNQLTQLENKIVIVENQHTRLEKQVTGINMSMNAMCDKAETMSIDIEYVRNLCNTSIENNKTINETVQLLLKKATSQCFTLDRLSLEVDDLKIETTEQNDKYSKLSETTTTNKCPENPSNVLACKFLYATKSTLKHGDLVCLDDGHAVKAIGGRWKKFNEIKNRRVILVQNNNECEILINKTNKIKIINVISVCNGSKIYSGLVADEEADSGLVVREVKSSVDSESVYREVKSSVGSESVDREVKGSESVDKRLYLVTYINEQDNLYMVITGMDNLSEDKNVDTSTEKINDYIHHCVTLEINDDIVNRNNNVCILENISNANIGSFCVTYDHSNNVIIVLFYNNLSNNYSLFLFSNSYDRIIKGVELADILTDTIIESSSNIILTVLPGQIILVNHGCRKFAIAITTYDSIISVGDTYIDYESCECCDSMYDAGNGYVITVEKTMTAVCFIQTLDILGTKIQKIHDKKIRHVGNITPINIVYDSVACHHILFYFDDAGYCVQRIDINDDILIGLKFQLPSRTIDVFTEYKTALNSDIADSNNDNKTAILFDRYKRRLLSCSSSSLLGSSILLGLLGSTLFLTELDGDIYCFENLYKQYPASFIGIANGADEVNASDNQNIMNKSNNQNIMNKSDSSAPNISMCTVCIKGQIFTSRLLLPKTLIGKKVYLSDTVRDFPYNLSNNNTSGVFVGTCVSDDSIVVGL